MPASRSMNTSRIAPSLWPPASLTLTPISVALFTRRSSRLIGSSLEWSGRIVREQTRPRRGSIHWLDLGRYGQATRLANRIGAVYARYRYRRGLDRDRRSRGRDA